MFGECQDWLLRPDSERNVGNFISALDRAMHGLSVRSFLGPFRFLRGRDTKWREDIAHVHALVDKYVDKALERETIGSSNTRGDGPRVFLDELVKKTKEKLELRNQMLNIFVPARDTTASTVSFVLFHLARNRKVWDKLGTKSSALVPPSDF